MTSCVAGDLHVQAGLTVLVVDDDADMRLLATTVLRRAGVEIAGEAADGEQVFAELRRLDPPPVPTVILLDNQMPGLTGLEVAARIRREMPDQLIVLFSAYLNDEIEAEAAELGFVCVSKSEALNLGVILKRLVAERNR